MRSLPGPGGAAATAAAMSSRSDAGSARPRTSSALRARRPRCGPSPTGRPSRTAIVSKTPRARVRPAQAAVQRARQPPRRWQPVGGQAQLRAERSDERARLVERLADLGVGVGVGDDPSAGADPGAAAGDLEGADRDVELQAGDRAREPGGAGVDVPRGALQLADHVQRLDLRGAGHRPGRERRAQQIRVADALAQAPGHGRHEVPDPRVGLGDGRRTPSGRCRRS